MNDEIITVEIDIDLASRPVMKLALRAHQDAGHDPALTVAHLSGALVLATRLSHCDLEQVIAVLRTMSPVAARMISENPDTFGTTTGRH